jgi:hypothetical protein
MQCDYRLCDTYILHFTLRVLHQFSLFCIRIFGNAACSLRLLAAGSWRQAADDNDDEK